MSSSPTDAAGAVGVTPSAREAQQAVRDQRWYKRALPRTLFGRSLLIIVVPLVLVQVVATWIFYDRVWDTVSRRLSAGVAGDIEQTIGSMQLLPPGPQRDQLLIAAGDATDLEYVFWPDEKLPTGITNTGLGSLEGPLEGPLAAAMRERVHRRFQIDAEFDPRDTLVTVALSDGVLQVAVPRKRLLTPTTYIFVLWMVGSSLVLFAVATMFMRNQVRSLRRLAVAAESFGKGREVRFFKIEGAMEVRQTAAAFLLMRERIRRQVTQRTEMLAGVSHDLRTPLTRMRLALEFLEESPTLGELKSDVQQMERMIEGYLEFARGEGGETPREIDLPMLLEEVAAGARRDGAQISVAAPEAYAISLRPEAMKRCIANLIANARRYGTHVWLTAIAVRDGIVILVDDDGPGIPSDQREEVFRPFFRLDPARGAATGGVGLGLTIARDVALSHGGDITLEDSPQGGLRVRVHLPN